MLTEAELAGHGAGGADRTALARIASYFDGGYIVS
jgi:hypothetical protein